MFKYLLLLSVTILYASVEKDVGQLIMTYANPGEEEALIQELQIGGIIYYSWANDLTSKAKVKALSQKMQRLAKGYPLLIGVDQEGGRVSRLSGDYYQLKSAREYGKAENPIMAFTEGCEMAKEMSETGINLNFAPVVDIGEGDRCYANDPEKVMDFASRISVAYWANGVFPCLKHFPGHGHASCDSHFQLPIVYKDREALDQCELFPYYRMVGLTPFIMTAHILFPELDPDYPATFSKKILTDLLRYEMGFEGIIITDSLKMKAAFDEEISMGEVAICAFEAGADILLIGGKLLIDADDDEHVQEVKEVRDALIAAVQSGRISGERLRDSLERILLVKSSIATSPFGHHFFQ